VTTSVAAPELGSTAERDRRGAALQSLLAEEGLDVLVLCGADYRGHKGTLRWAADYNLVHRYGFVVVPPGAEPELLLPENLAMGRLGGWSVPVRYVRRTGEGLVERLRELGSPGRIGIVGLAEVMKVADYLALRAGFPRAELVDVSDAFERLRAHKTPAELEGVRESTRIAEACFERLLEVTRPGVTERAVGAAMYECCFAHGGEDPLFLCMTGVDDGGGRVRGEFGIPADRVLARGSMLIFSFELVGRLGYWMEFARMVSLGEPGEAGIRVNAAVRAGMEAAADAMRPGARPADVQQALLAAVERHGARSTYWSGHGLGQDVLEEPWVGLEVVQDRDAPGGWTIAPGMAIAIHPYVVETDGRAIGYMADTYLTGEDAAQAVSSVSLDIHVIR
jgi:Xaa-Pro aminopeptidase